jgi:Protein kinase domain
MKCPACGEALADTSRFCNSCGRALDSEHAATRTVGISTPNATPFPRTASDGRFAPGETVAGRYRIIAMLGRGGMGEVYRADDLTLSQAVALKFLPAEIAGNPVALDRFRNEVRIARRVSHPNVCRVYDLGEVDGNYFLSMEYVDGEDLGALLRRIGRLPEDKALEISRRLCAGLAAAHEKGVLHRDLKPANVMLDARGQVLLSDFGLAGLAEHFEGAEIRNGTPAYMAPEQLAGKEVTARSDIYSLGLVMYELLTGKRAFDSDTLAGLERARAEKTITNPSNIIKDLDPRIERVILRCLEPEPANRPASALAVAAALPGGDPLAEALAAGDTPSPEMVAAAGEGIGFKARTAAILFAATVIALLVQARLAQTLSGVDLTTLDYSPEVLAQKARDTIAHLGYPDRPADSWHTFDADVPFLNYAQSHDHPPDWTRIYQSRPSVLVFRYRQSPYLLSSTRFHTDQLTPGMVDSTDPPVEMSGMINVTLDAQGRLLRFLAIPPQRIDKPAAPQSPDWKPFFAAADLDPSAFQSADPLWTFLAASDLRQAWTGEWPGSGRPLRVEAAALGGKPVAFQLIGPWDPATRMPSRQGSSPRYAMIAAALAAVVLASSIYLGRRNLAAGRGDRRGALRLAAFIFFVLMALWLARGHFGPLLGTFVDLIVAIATSLFAAAVLCIVYIALEPYARRNWPHALISWTAALNGRIRDPIVGRDVLIGVAIASGYLLIDRSSDLWTHAHGAALNFGDVAYLNGFRATIGILIAQVPAAIRSGLFFFLILFILRVLVRRQWLAGTIFAAILTAQTYFKVNQMTVVVESLASALMYSLIAFSAVRFGLLPMIVSFFVLNVLDDAQMTTNTAAWYFSSGALVLSVMIALAAWAFKISVGQQKLIPDL